MTCNHCGLDIGAGNHYCPWCGEPQPGGAAPAEPDFPESGDAGTGAVSSGPEDSAPVEEQLRQLRATVASQNAELARMSQRLSALERGSAAPDAPQQPQPETPLAPPQPPAAAPTAPQPPPAEIPPPQPESAPALSQLQAATPVTPLPVGEAEAALGRARRGPSQYVPAEETAAAESPGNAGGLSDLSNDAFVNWNWNWEWLLGGNWLARIGIVALIFGVAFFISLSIDRGWLGEMERVALGLAGGLAFLGAGEYWRKRYAVWAQTVTGGGLGILYLSVFGAFALYGLISPLTAFGAFFLITLAGAALALRHEAMGVAVLSIFGGFATPLLLQERLPDERLLLAYVLVLDVGVLALAGFRNWRWFTLLGWTGSLILFGFWQQELGPSAALAQIGITAIFLIFAGATIVFHVVRQRAAGIPDLALMTLNAAAFYGISYWLIYDLYRPWMGGFTVSVAAFYALLSAACRMRGAAQFNLTLFSAGLAVVFAVLAVPIQLGGPWISVAWGVEGLALVWMSFPLRMRELRWFGYVMFVVSAVWLLALDTPGAFGRDLTPFWNEYMISYGAAVILPALAAYLLHLRRAELEPREETAIPVFALLAAIFAVVVVPIQVDGIWIAIAWAVEAVFLLWLSFAVRMPSLRWFGYVMFIVFPMWLFVVDSPGAFWDDLTPIINWYMLSYAVAALASALSAWLLWHKREELARYEQAAYPMFAVGAAAVGAIAIPMQLEWPWITVAWAAEAVLLLGLSFTLQTRELRWFGYVLFAAFSVWLLVWDTPGAFKEDFTLFLNWYMLNYGVAILASVLAGYLLWRQRHNLTGPERSAHIVFAVASVVFAAIAVPVQLDGVWITIAWAVEAVLLLALAVRLNLREIRWLSYGLLSAMLLRMLALDSFDLDLETFRPVLNWRFLAFTAGIAAFYLASWLELRRNVEPVSPVEVVERLAALPVLLALANLATLWLLSAEIIASANSALLNLPDDVSENVASLGLSLLWAIYAAALIVLGVARRWRWVRVAGLALLAVPVIKLFAFDSLQLEQEYRVIAFLALGLILVAGGLLYQRYSRVVRGFLFE